jgi:hypothetical protein
MLRSRMAAATGLRGPRSLGLEIPPLELTVCSKAYIADVMDESKREAHGKVARFLLPSELA